MGSTELSFCEGQETRKVFVLGSECTEIDAWADKKVLQVIFGNDGSCLSQVEYPDMATLPAGIIVKGNREPVRGPPRRPEIETIQTAIARNMRIGTVELQSLCRCRQG